MPREPQEVRPDTVSPAAKDARIVRATIHPGIGVARIGNSAAEDGYYIGPEVVDPPPTLTGQTRDAAGAIKRQAARFRIYGYDASGKVVGEIGPDDADVAWTVHLANRKAQWYQLLQQRRRLVRRRLRRSRDGERVHRGACDSRGAELGGRGAAQLRP